MRKTFGCAPLVSHLSSLISVSEQLLFSPFSPTSFLPPCMFAHLLPCAVVSKVSRPFSVQPPTLAIAVLFLTG